MLNYFFKGEPFTKVKDRLLKKLGVQEKEFEKVSVNICLMIIFYESS